MRLHVALHFNLLDLANSSILAFELATQAFKRTIHSARKKPVTPLSRNLSLRVGEGMNKTHSSRNPGLADSWSFRDFCGSGKEHNKKSRKQKKRCLVVFSLEGVAVVHMTH